MVEAMAKAHRLQFGIGALEGIISAGEFERYGHVLPRGKRGNEVERLEHDANVPPAELRKLVLGVTRDVLARDVDFTGIRPFEASGGHQQGGLARARGADKAHREAARNIERKLLQDMHARGAGAEAQVDLMHPDRRLGLGFDDFRHHVHVHPRLRASRSRPISVSYTPAKAFRWWPLAKFQETGPGKGLPAMRFRFSGPPMLLLTAGRSLRLSRFSGLSDGRHDGGGAHDPARGSGRQPDSRLPARGKDAFPTVLEAALKAKGHDVVIENAGVSGDTTTGGLDRLDWSVPDGTDGVILELGANDALRGLDPSIPEKALDQIITG